MLFLGLDLGTSFLKGAVFDLDRRTLVHVLRRPFPDPLPPAFPGRVEYDPQFIVSEVRDLLRNLIQPGQRYHGLVVSTQMSCLILTDAHGRPQSNCIGWRDQRTLEAHPDGHGTWYNRLQAAITPQQRRELGNELSPGAPASFLFHMAGTGPPMQGLVPVSLGDFVACALTGCEPSVEPTNAMAYNLYHLAQGTWHREVIAQLGLDQLHWPSIRTQGEIVGYLQHDHPIPCYTPVGDFQCALAGVQLSSNELSLNISTGSQVSRLTPTLQLGDYQTRPYFDGAFVNLYSHLPAGRSLNVLVRLLTEIPGSPSSDEVWSYVDRAARQANSDLAVSLAFYPGPAGDDGSITNIDESNLTIGNLFRAAYQNMAQTYHRLALHLWPQAGWERLVFSGGLVQKSATLRESILHTFAAPHRLSPSPEDTLMGLLALARVFTGRSASLLQDQQQSHAANQPVASNLS